MTINSGRVAPYLPLAVEVLMISAPAVRER